MRSTSSLYSPDGYLINPRTNDTIWWHGDVAGSLYSTELFEPPMQSKERIEETPAAFFTSDERAAQFFALRGFSDRDEMFEEYTDADPTVWSVRIKARNLYAPTDLNPDFSNYESPEFANRLKREGYTGWWEQDTKSLQGIWNVALLYPERDVEVVSGYECRWRENPYSQTDDEGYLINPNDGSSLWYHFLTKEADDPESFEFQMGNFSGSELFNETYFAGDPLAYTDMFGWYTNYLTVKIRIGKDCNIFDARDLFREVPDWVMADITRAFNEVEDLQEPGQILFQGDDDAISQRTLDYLNSGDLGETLNLWRKNEAYLAFRKDINQENETWAEWLLWLWMLQFGYVYQVLSEPETFPILDPQITRNIIGWLERERCDGLSPEWNAITVAIAHNASYDSVGYMYVPCLDETKIEIVKRKRDRRYR